MFNELFDQMKADKRLRCIQYLVIAGSHSYGTTVENSDVDIRGWYFPPLSNILGMPQKTYDSIQYSNHDMVLYTFHKFVHLLAQCNPNVIEQLGVDVECILYQSRIAKLLASNSELFLSKRAFYTFGGYANTMLKRFEQGSPGWRNNKHTADKQWKHLMHLIRLLYMGIDILDKHQIITHRVKEHDLLMSIRHGEVEVEKIFDLRTKLEVQLQEAYDSSTLPDQAQMLQINDLVTKIAFKYVVSPNTYETNWDSMKGR